MTNETSAKDLTTIGKWIYAITVFFDLWLSGYVWLCGWNWYISPAANIQLINYPLAFGIGLLFSRPDVSAFREYRRKSLTMEEVIGNVIHDGLRLLILWGIYNFAL